MDTDTLLTIQQEIRSFADRAAFNYGARSPVAIACLAGDIDAFMAATKHVTEMTDCDIVAIQNKMICSRYR